MVAHRFGAIILESNGKTHPHLAMHGAATVRASRVLPHRRMTLGGLDCATASGPDRRRRGDAEMAFGRRSAGRTGGAPSARFRRWPSPCCRRLAESCGTAWREVDSRPARPARNDRGGAGIAGNVSRGRSRPRRRFPGAGLLPLCHRNDYRSHPLHEQPRRGRAGAGNRRGSRGGLRRRGRPSPRRGCKRPSICCTRRGNTTTRPNRTSWT